MNEPIVGDYVNYGGLATAPPPLQCLNANLYGFVLRADRQKLSDLCDRVFTTPSGQVVSVTPVSEHVLLMCGSIAHIVPQTAPFAGMGSLTENQASIWVPVLVRQGLLDVSLACFIPFTWVDNPISLTDGREVFGYAKTWGTIALPLPGTPTISVDAFGGDFGPHKVAGPAHLLEVDGDVPNALDDAGARPWQKLGDLITALRTQIVDEVEGIVEGLLDDLATRMELRLIFLKQFRAIAPTGAASLQQIVTAPVQLETVSGGPVAGTYAVTIKQLSSHPVGKELGLYTQQAVYAFGLQSDFTLAGGEVLWAAGPVCADAGMEQIELAGTP